MKIQMVIGLILGVILGAQAMASGEVLGGISGGGGGTTNPDPIDKEELVIQFNDDFANGYKIAYTWLIAQQKKFLDASAEEKATFPTRILFENSKDVFQVLRETKVEMRMNDACLDFDGAQKEGSVRSEVAGAICLSPHLMAPKLGRPSALKEITALYMHEISHLLGANEAQAVEIQKSMLRDMMFMNIGEVVTFARFGGSSFGVHGTWVNMIIRNPSENYFTDVLDDSVKELQVGHEKIRMGEDFSALRKEYDDTFMAYQALLDGVRDYMCSGETTLRGGQSADCARQIEKTFGNKESVTAWEFLEARQDYERAGFAFTMKYVHPSLKNFEIKRLHSREDAFEQMNRLLKWVDEVEASTKEDSEHVIDMIMN